MLTYMIVDRFDRFGPSFDRHVRMVMKPPPLASFIYQRSHTRTLGLRFIAWPFFLLNLFEL